MTADSVTNCAKKGQKERGWRRRGRCSCPVWYHFRNSRSPGSHLCPGKPAAGLCKTLSHLADHYFLRLFWGGVSVVVVFFIWIIKFKLKTLFFNLFMFQNLLLQLLILFSRHCDLILSSACSSFTKHGTVRFLKPGPARTSTASTSCSVLWPTLQSLY